MHCWCPSRCAPPEHGVSIQSPLQLNLSNTDTEGTERSVRIREVSVLKRSLWWSHFYDYTYSFKCSVVKTRLTLVFKLHLKLLIHSTKALSFSGIVSCTSQLYTNNCFKTKRSIIQISWLSGLFLWSQFGHEYLLVTIKIRSHILFKLHHWKVQ